MVGRKSFHSADACPTYCFLGRGSGGGKWEFSGLSAILFLRRNDAMPANLKEPVQERHLSWQPVIALCI